MKKQFLLISILFFMTTNINAQWKTSRFFKSESSYTASLQTKEMEPPTNGMMLVKGIHGETKEMCSLSKEDTRMLINILSSYNWQENTNNHEAAFELLEMSWGRYHYYIHNYQIAITSPNKRKVTLRVNGGGIGKDEFLITYSNAKPFGTLRLDGHLSSDDRNKIKQLFFKYNFDFNNIDLKENEIVKIKPVFNFYNVFYLELPIASLDAAQSKQLVHLYNSGWNNSAHSFEGGSPLPVFDLYTHHNFISYGNDFLLTDLSLIDFKGADKKTFEDLINNSLIGHNGEGEKIIENHKIKVYYQYKNGVLHGKVKIYNLEGKLTNEFIYDKGFPIDYIKYTDKGKKEKEIHFSPADMKLTWIEYDEKGNIKDSGKSHYKTQYRGFGEIENFYKTNK